ncbi:MAG: hypothetical protein E7451_00605 [Ruminococcaceae bacterium]|nr:hypothetical protein [Oscillospiraceae bacterium]
MNEKDILYALTDIRADFIREAAPVRRRPARRVLMTAVAASLALLLMGAGIIYGDSIQSWMDGRWSRENGKTMSQGQAALVDAMSQEIGLSETIGTITVDVDSAIFEDRGFRILVRVRGRQFGHGDGVCFDRWSMELEPDPTTGMGHGRGWEHAGFDGDGSWLLFFRCDWDQGRRPEEPFTVRLGMSDLILTGAGGETVETVQAGSWEFEFPLEVTGVPEPIALPDCTVKTETGAELELRNLMLYSTGLTYEKTGDGDVAVTVLLEDGSSIDATLGIGDSQWWDVPVDPAQVRALRIGETTIEVPEG